MFCLGQTVSYVLKPRDLPVDPNFEYHGVIVSITGNYLKVQLTDEAYIGYEEWIEARQVRKIESKMESKTV